MDELVRSKLSPDERILWEGRPALGIFIMGRKVDFLFIFLFIVYALAVIIL